MGRGLLVAGFGWIPRKLGKRHLDVAQLVKHYFGLSRLLLQEKKVTFGILLYLFWEPENALDLDICRRHRAELQELSGRVANSAVAFRWMSYLEVWREWEKVPGACPTRGKS